MIDPNRPASYSKSHRSVNQSSIKLPLKISTWVMWLVVISWGSQLKWNVQQYNLYMYMGTRKKEIETCRFFFQIHGGIDLIAWLVCIQTWICRFSLYMWKWPKKKLRQLSKGNSDNEEKLYFVQEMEILQD